MRLYLVQHGEAKPKGEDPERSLTDRGADEIREVARSAYRAGIKPARIYHSEKHRARQTAGLLAERLGCPFEAASGLKPNDDVQPWIDRLTGENQDLMLVGHLPFLHKLVMRLLSGYEETPLVAFRYGALFCLVPTPGRYWVIQWILHPELLPGLKA